ncbi:unnamed protein product [Lactuca virosa]|uniref:Uncharacterized protein n=1 Tax=Lactuca virosa TaxID=75947 RepID=A0AAU9MPJ7_9ASTR|nr:unnamed protein product [Lactuca virosa]
MRATRSIGEFSSDRWEVGPSIWCSAFKVVGSTFLLPRLLRPSLQGVLDIGMDVAVKRLSKSSGQGVDADVVALAKTLNKIIILADAKDKKLCRFVFFKIVHKLGIRGDDTPDDEFTPLCRIPHQASSNRK